MSTSTTPATLPIASAEAVRVAQIEAGLDAIRNATGEVLTRTIADLPRFSAVLEALIGDDDAHTRAFRRSVVEALHRVPARTWERVPARYGFNILHKVIHADGPGRALGYITNAPTAPTWTDLIRLYRPNYAAGNITTLAAHTLKARAARGPRAHGTRDRLAAAEGVAITYANWVNGRLAEADVLDAYNVWAHMTGQPLLETP